MATTDAHIGLRLSADLLDQVDADAHRLGLTRSALIRTRLQHPDQVDGAVLRDAAQQLRSLLEQIDTGQLGATPLAAPHLRGAADALDLVGADSGS